MKKNGGKIKKTGGKIKKAGGKTKGRMAWGDAGSDVGNPSGEATGNRWQLCRKKWPGDRILQMSTNLPDEPKAEQNESALALQATEQICLAQSQ